MSLQEIQSGLQAVGETVQTAQGQLTKALEFAEKARETLQGAASHSAQAEHGQAVSLFEEAEAALIALRNRLEQFHPAVASYLGSLGLNAASDGGEIPPAATPPSGPAGPPPKPEKQPAEPEQPPEEPQENQEETAKPPVPPASADSSGDKPVVNESGEEKSDQNSPKPDVESQNVDDSGDLKPAANSNDETSEPLQESTAAAESAEPEEEQVPIDKYRDMVSAIYDKPAGPMDGEPNYISEGGASYVFDAGDGTVVKVAKGSDEDYSYFDYYDPEDLEEGEEPPTPGPTEHEVRVDTVKALQRGKGIEGVEQLVTYGSLNPNVDDPLEDTDNLIIVTEKVSGETLRSMDNAQLAAIPEEHYEKFIDTLTAMRENGIVIDNADDDIMYNPETGFTAIDYNTVESRTSTLYPEPSTVEDLATSFADPAIGTLVKNQYTNNNTIPEHAVKYHDAVKRKLGDDAAARVRERIQQSFGSPWPKS